VSHRAGLLAQSATGTRHFTERRRAAPSSPTRQTMAGLEHHVGASPGKAPAGLTASRPLIQLLIQSLIQSLIQKTDSAPDRWQDSWALACFDRRWARCHMGESLPCSPGQGADPAPNRTPLQRPPPAGRSVERFLQPLNPRPPPASTGLLKHLLRAGPGPAPGRDRSTSNHREP